MKEDLAIARNSLMALQAENLALRRTAQSGSGMPANNNANVLDHVDPEMAAALALEKKKRQDTQRELELQVNCPWIRRLSLEQFIFTLFLLFSLSVGIG